MKLHEKGVVAGGGRRESAHATIKVKCDGPNLGGYIWGEREGCYLAPEKQYLLQIMGGGCIDF